MFFRTLPTRPLLPLGAPDLIKALNHGRAALINHTIAQRHDHGHEHEVNAGVSHERRDVNVFQVTAFGIGLLLSCIVVVFAMWAMFDFLLFARGSEERVQPGGADDETAESLPPEPRLQAEPKVELKDLRADEDAILNSYGWVNPDKGTVRIPIDQAIDIVAQKGLPSKPSPAGTGQRRVPDDSGGFEQRQNAGKDFAMKKAKYSSVW